MEEIIQVKMPPKQRPGAAGGGRKLEQSTAGQELGQQGRGAGPSPPEMASETKRSELRSKFERVMEASKCSCPTVIELAGDRQTGEATRCLDDDEAEPCSHDRRRNQAVTGRCQQALERTVEALGLAVD